jgi:hypothetical protein
MQISTVRRAVLAFGATLATAGFAAGPAMADDTVGPVASSLRIAQISWGDPGFVKQNSGGHFYVCAYNVQDPSGVKSVTMDVSSVGYPSGFYNTAALAMHNDDSIYNCPPDPLTGWTGVYEGEWVTNTTVPEGIYPWSVTMTDNLNNSSTQSSTVTVDNTAPKGTDVQSANGGAVVGKAELGDKVTFSFSEMLNRYVASETPRNVVVHIDNSGTNDVLTVWNQYNSAQDVYEGTIKLGGDYVSANRQFGATGTKSTLVRSGSQVILTLGTPNGTTNTVTGVHTMTWAPSTTAMDPANNHVLPTTLTQTGPGHPAF